MWDYKRVDYKFSNISEIEKKLNDEGKDGWEIIYYHETKPAKFGDNYVSMVLYKKMCQLPSG